MIFGECDTEAPAFYTEKRVKVRRPQMCRETGRAIMPGEHAWRIVGKWGRSVETIYQTDSAYHFARYLNLRLNGGKCAVLFGEVTEAVGQLAYDDPRVGVALEAIWRDIVAGLREWTAEDKCPDAERRLEAQPDPLAAECLDLLRKMSAMRPCGTTYYLPGVLMGPSTVTGFRSGEFGQKQFAFIDHGDPSAALLAALRWVTGSDREAQS